MARHTFIQMSKLHNVKGRISYISSHERQENLYATYATCDRSFWKELARENQEDFLRSGATGKCIEARELIIALPEYFTEFTPEIVLMQFTEHFKEKYGLECISALHHNKTKTNYHIHLIFSERQLLEGPVEKIATRNMYFDEHHKHVRTKKEIVDEDGTLRAGCKVVCKGEVYERHLFEKKNPLFKDKDFLAEVKELYTDLINDRTNNDELKLAVFEKDGIYLPTKKIGKRNPKETEILENNAAIRDWNATAERAAEFMPEENIKAIRKQEVGRAVERSMTTGEVFRFGSILERAINTIKNFTNNWVKLYNRPTPSDRVFYELLSRSRASEVREREDLGR